MKKSLLVASCFLLSFLFGTQYSIAQTPISPYTWSGSGATAAAGASNFTTRPASATPTSTVVNISQWQRGPGVDWNAAGSSYNSKLWCLGSSLPAAQAGGNYIYFTVTNNGTTELEITNLLVQSQVSATGPSTVQMQYCTSTSGDQNFGSAITVTSFATPTSFNFTLSAGSYVHVCAGQTDTFKLYGWNASNIAGTLRINDNTSITAAFTTAVVANATSNASPSLCNGASVTLMFTGSRANGIAPYTYVWTGPAAGSLSPGATSLSPGITNPSTSASGYYTLTVTDNWGCKAAASTPVIISPTPSAPVTTPTGTFTICSNDSVVFTAPTGYTYEWRTGAYPGTPIAGATNQSYTARTANRYRVAITNSYGCTAVGTPPDTLIVNTAPTATVTASGPLSFCAGNSVTLTSTTGTGNLYQWFNGTTAISGATNNVYLDTNSGNLHIRVTATNGCVTNSSNFVVTEVTLPVASTTGDTSFCVGGSVLLNTSISAGATGVLLQWKKNTVNIPGATTTSYVANTSGNYSCYVNIPSSCSVNTNSINVTVFPLPVPVVSFNGFVFKTGNFYATYQWYVNTVTIPGATTNSVTAHSNGSYRVLVTDTNGCTKLSDAYNLNNLAVNNVNNIDAVHIFPNPASDVLHIDAVSEVKVIITSMEGKKVLEATGENDINLAAVPAGMYLVMVYDRQGNRLLVEKVIKQ